MLTLAGDSDADASKAVTAVMKIETALAQARLSRVELRDPKVQDHAMSFTELKGLVPHFDWDSTFQTLNIPKQGRINVPQPKLVQTFDNLLNSTSLEDWKLYLQWRVRVKWLSTSSMN
jgi:predicted metalloendopeptidase